MADLYEQLVARSCSMDVPEPRTGRQNTSPSRRHRAPVRPDRPDRQTTGQCCTTTCSQPNASMKNDSDLSDFALEIFQFNEHLSASLRDICIRYVAVFSSPTHVLTLRTRRPVRPGTIFLASFCSARCSSQADCGPSCSVPHCSPLAVDPLNGLFAACIRVANNGLGRPQNQRAPVTRLHPEHVVSLPITFGK